LGLPTLSEGAEFAFGCVGGGLAAVLRFLRPELRATWRSQDRPNLPCWKIGVGIAIIICLTLLGGAAAVFLGDATQAKHAIAYGISAETILSSPAKRRFG
jgi:hypothetical protein